MQRTINIEVAGNRARASSRELGTQGEVAAVTLALSFDGGWNGLTKRLLWRSASGEATGYTLLTAPGADGVYTASVPALPLSEAGRATLTVEGVAVSGAELLRRARSVQLAFNVEPNDLNADSPAQAVDPTVAEQLAAALDGKAAVSHTHVKADVTDFAHTHARSEIAGLDSALAGKAAASHTHSVTEITDIDEFVPEVYSSDVIHYNAVSGAETDVGTALGELEADASIPTVRELLASLTVSGWSSGDAPEQSFALTGVTSSTCVLIAVAPTATDEQYVAAANACLRFSVGSGRVTARVCGVRPAVLIPLKIGVVK